MVETGPGWEFTPAEGKEWKPAAVIAKYGSPPWGDALTRGGAGGGAATDIADIQALPGFNVELLYTVPKAEQGSWVSMTVDPQGRLVVCDQYGSLYRVTTPAIGTKGTTKVEPLPIDIGGAHGLLHAFGHLYVMLNETSATPNKGNRPFDLRVSAEG